MNTHSFGEVHHPDEIVVSLVALDDSVGLEQGDVCLEDVVVQVGQPEEVSLAVGPVVPQVLQEVGEAAAAGAVLRGGDLFVTKKNYA